MPAHRFKLELAGQMIHGVAFATEAELEQFCGARGLEIASTTAPADPPANQPRPRGRPSFDSTIAAAVAELEPQLAGCGSNVSARARLVLRHLASNHAAEDLPKTGAVRAFLAERAAVVKNSAEKSANKSKRARIRRTGGPNA